MILKLSQSLGDQIKNYIVNLLNKEASVLDGEGKCISSTNQEKLGQIFSLPTNSRDLTSARKLEIENIEYFVIPLKYENENVAFLYLENDSEEIKSMTSLIKSFAELIIQQYFENNKPKLDSTDQFVIKLLNNASINELPFYESESKALGYNMAVPRMAIAIHLKGFWENCLLDIDQPSFERDQVIKNWKRNIELALNSFFTKNNDQIISYIGSDKFVIFKAVEKNNEETIVKLFKKSYRSIFESLKTHRIKSIAVGFGNAYPGVDGLIKAYREADITLELGQRLWGADKSYYFGDLGILSILAQGERDKKVEFATQLLGKLNNEELNKTLECFFEHNLNLTETADKMGIHRNTVIYRLNQITKMLDADPRVFEQAMTIKIALLIKSLFG